ncbi:MAG: MBL fold metallo-hydrolase [Bacilli bacterium]|nr:MBL fold metallo-hydrolase [Bacilli bacterium]MBN2696097.1 MBL fold metallo-hydrolase [Bacilli bacterium]
MKNGIKIKIFYDNIAGQNSYLIISKESALLIDPGFNGEAVHDFLEQNKLILDKVLLTHGHFDHVRDILFLRKHYDFPIFVHEKDKEFLYDERHNYARAFHSHFVLDKDAKVVGLKDGETVPFGDQGLITLHTPGHTGGSACYKLGNLLFSGDTLFKDSVGRTDLSTGSQNDMHRSVSVIFRKCSLQTKVYPGHGESAELKQIKLDNPFCQNI